MGAWWRYALRGGFLFILITIILIINYFHRVAYQKAAVRVLVIPRRAKSQFNHKSL